MQAEDSEMGDTFRVLQNGLNPSPYELRAFLLESRHLLSLRPEIRLEDGVMVKVDGLDWSSLSLCDCDYLL